MINSDEQDAQHGVRSGPGEPSAREQSDKPVASSCKINREMGRESL
jgi:hypothetical protein